MPLAPNAVEHLLFLTLNQAPGPLLDLWSGPAFRLVVAAIRLNVFTTLQDQPATVDELAQRLQTDPRGTRLLLETLAALGYVKPRGQRYANTAMTRKWLTGDGVNLSSFFQYWGIVIEQLLPSLEASIRSGQPPINLYTWIEIQPEASRYFQEAMIALTRFVQADVVAKVKVSAGARRLLDVGGGHAAYSIALCQKYPQLSAVVFDGSQALTVGRESVQAAGMTDRITLRTGNMFSDEWGAGFDLLLLFNIVHGLSAAENVNLLRQAKRALNPKGQVIILEQMPGATPLPLNNAIVRILGMSFFHLLGGQVYDANEIQSWLATAGFSAIRRTTIAKAGSVLLTGVC